MDEPPSYDEISDHDKINSDTIIDVTCVLGGTKLSDNVTKKSRSLRVNDTTTFHDTGMIKIDDEIIEYSKISNCELAVIKRGLYNTMLDDHDPRTNVDELYLSDVVNTKNHTGKELKINLHKGMGSVYVFDQELVWKKRYFFKGGHYDIPINLPYIQLVIWNNNGKPDRNSCIVEQR